MLPARTSGMRCIAATNCAGSAASTKSLRFGEDLDFFNRLQKAGIRFALCDVDAMIYRRHASNLTNDQERMKRYDFRSDQTADGSDSPNEVQAE